MNRIELEIAMKLLLALFPQADLNDEEQRLFAERFAPYPLENVRISIEEHRAWTRFSRPDMGKILQHLRETAHKQIKRPVDTRYQSLIALQLQADPRHSGKPEEELIASYYRNQWLKWYAPAMNRIPPFETKLSAEQQRIVDQQQQAIDTKRASIRRACIIDIGAHTDLTHAKAELWGNLAVGDESQITSLLAIARGQTLEEAIF